MTAASRNAIHSMTGYGRATKRTVVGIVTVELRSTNHRYLEVEPRLPNGLNALQARLTEHLRSRLRRGRIEATIAWQAQQLDQRRVVFDERLLQRYYQALIDLKGRFGLKGPVTLTQLLALPQAMTVSEERVQPERLWDPLRSTVDAALDDLLSARRREGAKLTADIRRQIQSIAQHLRQIKARLPKALEHQRRALREQLQKLLGPSSSGATPQLEQAIALVKDVDIHEELVRLESHLAYMRQTLGKGQLVGKRLDFIAQELTREANTMGAKVNDPEASQHVVDIKGCIEKIREQVQNLE